MGLVLPLFAADPLPPLKPQPGHAPLKVACVGDSITMGVGAAAGFSYPSQLQDLLGNGWQVGNFGVSGRTLLKKGDFSYWNEDAFKRARDFAPDVVIVMLGTNDTKPQNWVHKAEFETDYRDLVGIFRQVKSKPRRIYVCRPVPVVAAGLGGINEAALQEQMPVLERIAAEPETGVIDMHAALEGKPQLLPDNVHPSTDGAAEMAKAAFRALTGTEPALRFRLNSLFSDNAVLQRGVPLPVWGTAPDGDKVSVEFAGQTATTTAAGGKWRVTLKPLSASSTPATMTISGSGKVSVQNLLVGDVWLASGQSNMERQLGPRARQKEIPNWRETAAAADFPLIREYHQTMRFSDTAIPDGQSNWRVCSPETAADFSAVAFFFARDLQPEIKVPVGIIHSSWGGTVVEAWMGPEPLKSNSVAVGKVKNQNSPGGLYNAMIAPLVDFPIKGAIWYQGESNKVNPGDYLARFSSMIGGWRADWKQPELPFLFAQLTPYKDTPPELREAQLQTLGKVPHTGMAVLTDIGDENDIHPVQKEAVGKRLALAARAIAYGGKNEWSGPLFKSMEISGGKAVISFTHTGKGLVAKDGPLKGFAIAGADGNFLPAEAEIRGDQVVVGAGAVPEPKAVRFGWANSPEVNLFNQDGLPASPFRTDGGR